MVNEERVKLMTHMAVEAGRLQGEGVRISHFYRGDYVGFEIVKSVVSATIVYGVIVALYAVFNFNALLEEFYNGAGVEELKIFVVWYIALLAVSVLASYVVYSIRFNRAKSAIRSYYAHLKRLERMYRQQAREQKQ